MRLYMDINQKILDILRDIKAHGGRPLIVGGAVRDWLLGKNPKDVDVEVYGMTAEELTEVLSRHGRVDLVGVSFGVIKLTTLDGIDFDFTLPRRESKIGQGHRGFMVEPDPTMTPIEAAARRDFTWNALAYDPFTGEILDYFGGVDDLRAGVLRHTSPRFADDSLRVLRGMQFTGRMDMLAPISTIQLARELLFEYHELAVERVWMEWWKWATRSVRPSRGLVFLRDSWWIFHYPELQALVDCPQDPDWHPEGDAWQHTLHTVDAAAKIAKRENLSAEEKAIQLLAALCHDLGKPTTTRYSVVIEYEEWWVEGEELVCEDGYRAPIKNQPAWMYEHWVEEARFRSRGHAEAGEEPARSFLKRIGAPKWIVGAVIPLVKEHMAHVSMNRDPSDRAIRRLANRLAPATIQQLSWVVEADHSGRPPLPAGNPFVGIAHRAAELAVLDGRPAPILMGRHLISELDLEPGPYFGQILREAFQAQLDGVFMDLTGALVWARENGHSRSSAP